MEPASSRFPVLLCLVVTIGLSACEAVTLDPAHIDWSATGAMLGGIGAAVAALGTAIVIWLTRKYVRINAKLLELNSDSLQTLRESVRESSRQAEAAAQNARILAEQWSSEQRERLLPIRIALSEAKTMIQNFLPRLADAQEYGFGERIRSCWQVPAAYIDACERARHISPELYGEMTKSLRSLNAVAQQLDYFGENWQAWDSGEGVKALLDEALHDVERVLDICETSVESSIALKSLLS
jgi:hypothetical protein